MSLKIVPFHIDYLEEAAALVAARYQTARKANLLWTDTFEQADAVLPRLQRLVEGMPGAAAFHENRLTGFLLAWGVPLFHGVRGTFSPDCGHAAEPEEAHAIYCEMYAHLAPQWIADGRFTHAIQNFVHSSEALDAWFSLGFGMVVIDALRDISLAQGKTNNIEIRRAGPDDIDIVQSLEIDLHRHLASSPSFLPLMFDDGRKSREKWLSDERNALWLAYSQKEVKEAAAFICIEPSTHEALAISDDHTASITGAFTREEARSGGIATTLLNHALEWARTSGYDKCAVDFESANILASRFWHGSGFQPVCYSVSRRIDSRIAWAHKDREVEIISKAYEAC